MEHLIVFVIAAEKAVRLKAELKLTKLDCHGLFFDAKLLKCVRMARQLGFLNWN